MRRLTTSLLAALLLSASAVSALALEAGDPSGHWEGVLSTPAGDRVLEFDLVRGADGRLAGGMNVPAEGLKGLPLRDLAADGLDVRFALAINSGGEFEGGLTEGGKTLTGELRGPNGTAPLVLHRMGAAEVAIAPRNAAIDPALAGAWSGALDIGGQRLRVVLKLANTPDGASSTAALASLDEGLEGPVAVAPQPDGALQIDAPMFGATYRPKLDAEGRLSGHFAVRDVVLDLVLTRAPAG